MNLHKWLAALFVLLALSGCASMATDQVQAPVPSHSHDDGPDMRTGNQAVIGKGRSLSRRKACVCAFLALAKIGN
jgi:hypothetical protein